MPNSIETRIATLPNLSRKSLCEMWQQLFHSLPPSRLRRDLLIRVVAYRIQEQALGSMSTASRARLRQIANAFEADSKAVLYSVPRIKPGTRLVRQWRDEVHLVNVEARGYEYRGVRYQSLSEIARQITGTRWSGPAFFGLRDSQTANQKEIQ